MKKILTFHRMMTVVLVISLFTSVLFYPHIITSSAANPGAKIVERMDPDRGRYHLGKQIGVTDELAVVPRGNAVLTDISLTSSNPSVYALTPKDGYWTATRLKEGTSVVTLNCKANGTAVSWKLLVSSFTPIVNETGEDIESTLKNGTIVYYGASDTEGISSAKTEVKDRMTEDKEIYVKYQCGEYYRVELQDDTFADTGEDWGYVKKDQIDIPITSVAATESLTLYEKETGSLNAHAIPSCASNPSLLFQSSNTNVATVSNTGMITAHNKGNAVITVTSAANPTLFTKCHITVKPYVPVTGIQILPGSLEIDDGTYGQFQVSVLPEDASVKEYMWKISDDSIIDVDSRGNYTALKPGNTQVSVITKEGSFTDTCQITVNPVPLNGVTLQNTMNIGVGDTRCAIWHTIPQNASNKNVAWHSSNTQIASVDKKGWITGHSAGQTQITLQTEEGGFTASCTVTVENYVEDLHLNINNLNLTLGKNKQLKVQTEPANPTRKNLIWNSKNKSVATIDQNGTIRAKATGLAEIMIYDRYSGAYDCCIVSVRANLGKPKLSIAKKKKKYTLSWTKVERATHYCIYEYKKKHKKFVKSKTLGKDKKKYALPSPAKGSRYKVRAYYDKNKEYGSYSSEVKVK